MGSWLLLGQGRRLGQRFREQEGKNALTAIQGVERSILWLAVLLLAFAFQGALHRYEQRQRLTLQEAAAISTVGRYLDFLPADIRMSMTRQVGSYLEHRIELTRRSVSFSIWEGAETYSPEETARVLEIKHRIREGAHLICGPANASNSCRLLVPALNRMFEASVARDGANRRHPPHLFFAALFSVGLAASLVAGFGMASSAASASGHMIAFATLLSVIFYVITDLEFPRIGLIRLDTFDHVLEDVLQEMN